MENENFDLSKMTVEDLFRAKNERRQLLASLSFEQKIEIVKKLQTVSRATHDRDQRPEGFLKKGQSHKRS